MYWLLLKDLLSFSTLDVFSFFFASHAIVLLASFPCSLPNCSSFWVPDFSSHPHPDWWEICREIGPHIGEESGESKHRTLGIFAHNQIYFWPRMLFLEQDSKHGGWWQIIWLEKKKKKKKETSSLTSNCKIKKVRKMQFKTLSNISQIKHFTA